MSKNVLITGITGFSGSHLAEHCINKGYNVFGLTRGRYHQYTFINHIKDKLNLIEGDLSDIHSVMNCLKISQPEVIFHLGAMTSVPYSWNAPKVTIDTNSLGTLNILESIRKIDIDPIVVNIGTSEEYGLVHPDEVPIKETNPLRPLSPYAVSKIASDMFGYQYFKSYGLKIIRLRPFNIIGPRGGQEIVTANFATQIAKIEKGMRKPYVEVGNLDSIRDFNDVRDIVRAYDISTKNCKFGDVYNICTGEGITIYSLLRKMINLSKISHETVVEFRAKDERMRPSDVVNLIGDSTKFKEQTGWKQEYTLDDSIITILNYWRQHA